MNSRHMKLQQLHDERMALIRQEIDADSPAKSTPTAAQRELDDLRWQVEQVDAYGSYMRHCIHPITFAEWIERRRALIASVRS